MDVLYQGRFQRVTFDAENSLLTLTWLAGTKWMNSTHARGALLIFAGCVLEARPRRVLITDEEHDGGEPWPAEPICSWWSREISPRCNEAGIEKMAFLHRPYPNGRLRPEETAQRRRGQSYETLEFNDSDTCWAWLSS